MNINFDSATYNALLNRAKAEGKSIPKLVNELLITVLTKEELNDQNIKTIAEAKAKCLNQKDGKQKYVVVEQWLKMFKNGIHHLVMNTPLHCQPLKSIAI